MCLCALPMSIMTTSPVVFFFSRVLASYVLQNFNFDFFCCLARVCLCLTCACQVRFPSGAKGKSSGDKDYEEVLHVHVTGTSRGWFLNGSKTTTAAGARGATSAAADGFLLPSPSAAASSALSLPHFDPLPATDPITNRVRLRVCEHTMKS